MNSHLHDKPQKKRRGGSKAGRQLSDWQKSARFKDGALKALRRINRRRDLYARCEATAKSTGRQCGNLAAHGTTKCYLHGGATPRGDNWHKPTWPKPSDPRAMQKIDRKLRERARDAKERDARLASLPPKLRQRYADWVRTHKPGPAADRRRESARRRQDLDAKALHEELISRPAPPASPELLKIEARIAELEAERAMQSLEGIFR